MKYLKISLCHTDKFLRNVVFDRPKKKTDSVLLNNRITWNY